MLDLIKRRNRLIALAMLVALLCSVLTAPAVYAIPVTDASAQSQAASPSDALCPANSREVYLVGEPAGIRLRSDGVVIADTAGVITDSGTVSPSKASGLETGDTVLRVDGQRVESSEQLIEAVENSGGNTLSFTIRRGDGSECSVQVTPVYSVTDSRYRVGLWVKDGTAGIGVISFVVPGSMVFGAVGHPLSDNDAPAAEHCEGVLSEVTLTGIRKGTRGSPGELVGYLNGDELGTVCSNSPVGIFGSLCLGEKMSSFGVPSSSGVLSPFGGHAYGVASKGEVSEGPAQLLIRLPGEQKAALYSVEIESINSDQSNLTRNMIIRVTDKALSERTGGIVQGMSGSPIIQNGRFAACVTHVFVSDPLRGYAVFAENMIDQINTIVN